MTIPADHKSFENIASSFPRHVAIIMDGNGRWAKKRGLPRAEGHRRGVEAVRSCVRGAAELGISYLTLYTFSSENWRRPSHEISDLMGLLKLFIKRDLADLHRQNVQIRSIGTYDGVDKEVVNLICDAIDLTKDNTGLVLTTAFNYGARDEIVRAARALAAKVERGAMRAEEITAENFADHLDTADIPEPDLLIRTGGDQRVSNFLLWQCAYSEFVFFDAFWPDFTKDMLLDAVLRFQSRERRFGGLNAKCSA